MQYIINYSFMILNLFIYIYIFSKENIKKLRISTLISVFIYMLSIYLSIITKTSSSTYIEGMGYKGWFESGNSISSILILSAYIYLPLIKTKKYKIAVIINLILVGIYLTTLIGTRVGLYGFILVIFSFIISEIITYFIKNKKINKKILLTGIAIIGITITIITIIGSNTLERRKHLQEIEGNIVDENTNEESHITGSLLEIKKQIEEKTIEEGYLSKAQEESILELYDIANELKIKNNDQRMQQLIYNTILVKNQKDISLILFGNGYLSNYRELVFEMEVPAILFNFGILGFIIYLMPFISIIIYSIYIGIKNIKEITSQYILTMLGSMLVFALSFLSGYTFFNSSTMIIIVVLHTLLINETLKLKDEKRQIKI